MKSLKNTKKYPNAVILHVNVHVSGCFHSTILPGSIHKSRVKQ